MPQVNEATNSANGTGTPSADLSTARRVLGAMACVMERAGLAVTMISLLVVTILAWCDTTLSGWDTEVFSLASESYPRFGLAKVALTVAMILVATCVCRVAGKLRAKVLVPVVAVAMTVATIALVVGHATVANGFGDANFLIQAANDNVTGKTELSQRLLDYLSRCPYQSGMYCYYVLMFKVFGENNILSLQVMGAIANLLAFLSICSIARRFLRSDTTINMLVLSLALLLPFWLLAGFPYGNATGFGFVMAFVALQVEAMRSSDIRRTIALSVASIPFAVMGLAIKSTFILMPIAVIVVWVIRTLRESRRAVGLAMAMVVILASNLVSSACEGYAGRHLGSPIGDGLPIESRLLIGLTESEHFTGLLGIEAPGWWDKESYDIYWEVEGDVARQRQIATERLREAVGNFVRDPAYAYGFFKRKLISEWVDPTFNAVAYMAYNSDANGRNVFCNDEETRPAWERAYKRFVLFEGALQCTMLTFASVGLFLFVRRTWHGGVDSETEYPMLVICAIFCLGFVVYLLWEAKGVYCLPFFMMVPSIGAYGLQGVTEAIGTRLKEKATDAGVPVTGAEVEGATAS